MRRSIVICYWVLSELLRIKINPSIRIDLKTLATNIFRQFQVVDNFHKLPEKNTIIIANYPCNWIEYLLHSLVPKNICLMMDEGGKKFIQNVYTIDKLILLKSGKGNYNEAKREVENKIKNFSIFVYVNNNKTKFHNHHIGRLRKGIFYIAKELNISITPIIFEYVESTIGFLTNKKIRIKVGDTTNIVNVDESIKSSREYFQKNIIKFKKTLF